MPSLLAEVRGLTVAYGGVPAVDGVDLAVLEGSVVALLGPNGAGKSTLLRAIAGLERPRAGDVLLRGESIVDLPPHERAARGVCFVPEGRGIFPTLTVADNLRVAVDGAAASVEAYFPVLGERRAQLAGTLSGGEQQMLALARAIGRSPALLMLDEPSLGLAPKIGRRLADSLRRLRQEEGRTMLLVEQHVSHAVALADVVHVLSRGRVVWTGDPDELRSSPVLARTYLGG